MGCNNLVVRTGLRGEMRVEEAYRFDFVGQHGSFVHVALVAKKPS